MDGAHNDPGGHGFIKQKASRKIICIRTGEEEGIRQPRRAASRRTDHERQRARQTLEMSRPKIPRLIFKSSPSVINV